VRNLRSPPSTGTDDRGAVALNEYFSTFDKLIGHLSSSPQAHTIPNYVFYPAEIWCALFAQPKAAIS